MPFNTIPLSPTPITTVNAALLVSGPPDLWINADTLTTQQRNDLQTLADANGGTFPLASPELMYTTLLASGNSWYKTHSSIINVTNERYNAASVGKIPATMMGSDLVITGTLQPIHYPTLNFKATLLAGSTGTTVVNLVDQNSTVLGTFSLDTVGTPISSGLLTNLAGQIRYVIVSGSGQFTITASISA